MSGDRELQLLIFKRFKSKGLSLDKNAADGIKRILIGEDDKEGSLNLILEEVGERIERNEIKRSIIDLETINSIYEVLSSVDEDFVNERIQYLDAFETPKIYFDEKQKSYRINTSLSYKLIGNVESRAAMFKERLQLAQQKLLRNGFYYTG